ncbi:hypothetical protein KPH14_008346 [Odynerus spinipes]|uniref:Endonuclease/exonuclease/phosphatase domain-containing protein n=1 Tax=Odynerus spinipes TaxID=1348599 RepID=A0AAD9VHP2_9HYME|nr:hypothetical protein KPH14_008346 [Odynerus spinipes]
MTSSETTTPANVIAATGVSVLQLNLGRLATATGEVRQLISEKRLDTLLLQEPYVQKRAKGYAFVGLGTGIRVAAVRSKHRCVAVVVCNPAFQMIFVSQGRHREASQTPRDGAPFSERAETSGCVGRQRSIVTLRSPENLQERIQIGGSHSSVWHESCE